MGRWTRAYYVHVVGMAVEDKSGKTRLVGNLERAIPGRRVALQPLRIGTHACQDPVAVQV